MNKKKSPNLDGIHITTKKHKRGDTAVPSFGLSTLIMFMYKIIIYGSVRAFLQQMCINFGLYMGLQKSSYLILWIDYSDKTWVKLNQKDMKIQSLYTDL